MSSWRSAYLAKRRDNFTFTFPVFVDPEDGGNMFLRNVDLFPAGYTATYPRGKNYITTAVRTSRVALCRKESKYTIGNKGGGRNFDCAYFVWVRN
jgi:hypothetical protein